MWKVRKLVVLLVAAVVLVIGSNGVWNDVLPTEPIDWTADENQSVNVLVDPTVVSSATVSIHSWLVAALDDVSLQYSSLRISWRFSRPQGAGYPVIVAATDRTADIIDFCVAASGDSASQVPSTPGSSPARLVPVDGSEVERSYSARSDLLVEVSSDRYYRLSTTLQGSGGEFVCDLNPQKMWTASQGKQRFSRPDTRILAFTPDRDLVLKKVSVVPGRAGTRGRYCVITDVVHDSAEVITQQVPGASGDRYFTPSADTALWQTCSDPPADPRGGYDGVYSPPIFLELSNVRRADQVARNLFIAGALLGVLGGLAIEVISTAFEVAEARAARRRRARPVRFNQR